MDTLLYIGIGLAVILVVGYIGWFLNALMDAVVTILVDRSNLKDFKSDFEKAVIHSQTDWEGIKRIALTRSLKPHQIFWPIEEYIRDIKTGENEKLIEHLDLIESYAESYRHDEPFESLPSDIRLHLERVREKLGTTELLNPLTNQIKDLLSIQSRENKRAKFYSVSGFITGVIGIVLAIIFYVVPFNSDITESNSSNTHQEQVVNK